MSIAPTKTHDFIQLMGNSAISTSAKTPSKTAAVWAVALGFGCGAALEGWAAPPAARDVSPGAHQERNPTHFATSVAAAAKPALSAPGAAQPFRDSTERLDLRPPEMINAAMGGSKAGPMPRDVDEGSYQSRVAAVAGRELPMQGSSRLQEFAGRVGREGLPIARLFESRSALVSLGLSPRGKPGLWLIQKTH